MHDETTLHVSGSNGRRYSPVPCTTRLDLGPTRLTADTPVATPEPYPAGALSHGEAARLLGAKNEAEAALRAAHEGLLQASADLIGAWHQTRAALHRLALFAASRELYEATQELRRNDHEHADDRPEDRRERPIWQHPGVVWTVILISAVYDTVFFSDALRSAIDAPVGVLNFEYWASLVPGVGIAVALILAGSWLAVPLFRHRAWVDRRQLRGRLSLQTVLRRLVVWRAEEEHRTPADPPWPAWALPLTFAGLVVGVLGTWAWIRGDQSEFGKGWPMVALLVLLTISAIAFKANAYHPEADRAARIKRRLLATSQRGETLSSEARDHLDAYEKSWHKLSQTKEDASGAMRRPITRVWEEVAEERARHGLTGMVAPSFQHAAEGDVVGDQIFEGLAGPPLRDTALRRVGELLDTHHHETLADELAALERQLEAQKTVSWPPMRAISAGSAENSGGERMH
ncbi:hypothetical protein [Micromonospora maris]|uniref:Uncharacterized protein n=1 Tax=Micromonospora maris TaxID=1003110 RepID=A0A9X0LFQ4_9ACTN|nr:hypothetical protein [Micromonospora maris]AEB43133.1 hypothetical protein VAB18032_10075 [Micromonospora maris AB-18-032]KUJ48498.1 hypothetical protein ADL17_05495 [Micromonospora maris]